MAPPATAGYGLGDLTSINDHQLLFLERDGLGDGVDAPRFKKVFVLDIGKALKRGGFVTKSLLVDLLAVPDPQQVGNDGAFFRFPFNTIESVHVVDQNTIISADDNNFPFSNGRSRSKTNARTGPLAADDNELILIQLGTPLDVDKRLLRPPPEHRGGVTGSMPSRLRSRGQWRERVAGATERRRRRQPPTAAMAPDRTRSRPERPAPRRTGPALAPGGPPTRRWAPAPPRWP